MIKIVKEVNVIEGSLYSRIAEDGEIVCYDCWVVATCSDTRADFGIEDGEEYIHNLTFKGAFQDPDYHYYHVDRGAVRGAEKLAARVGDRGYINTNFWTKSE